MKPHIAKAPGAWLVVREGREEFRASPGLGAPRPTFPEACHLAMLAAIHSGVWRA